MGRVCVCVVVDFGHVVNVVGFGRVVRIGRVFLGFVPIFCANAIGVLDGTFVVRRIILIWVDVGGEPLDAVVPLVVVERLSSGSAAPVLVAEPDAPDAPVVPAEPDAPDAPDAPVELSDELEAPSSAAASPGLLAIATPTPSATASAPTLPMNRPYVFGVVATAGVLPRIPRGVRIG
ncbi:hypothetical protein [Mycolicibacterium celeriflavum]|uniref:Uncharacterized protein n=1 Tax=Mycolicibacterium celeriflavum TaxID=1249101 RepID=A0A1X0BX69_MYCCF|nr:hypothetical protein [Mycolicibacterium celeriflavum]MCV7240681.1 hypothetical protein [Mycolicibacterium celeriflavum]ORA48152.1 hypothetical protein BST21_11115 [Mycolicibacterium celeriflavum]BBY43528.1 hypothetical protein MCEL_18230 [Mycolicibacterium celeriflavum]